MKFYRISDQIVISDKALKALPAGTGTELQANTTDAAGEEHVPVISISNNTVTVKVGSVEHPSIPAHDGASAHYIEFIILETDKGMQARWLKPGKAPAATFVIAEDETVLGAYEYCNLHGLWYSTLPGQS